MNGFEEFVAYEEDPSDFGERKKFRLLNTAFGEKNDSFWFSRK